MEYKAFTAQGNRDINEDSHVCIERNGNYCFVVADGLGGHGKGEVASRNVIEVFQREFGAIKENCSDFLLRSFMIAQATIMAMQKAENEMKTTAVALAMINNKLVWGHIGDSRLYYFRKGKLVKRTNDHSVAQILAFSEKMSDAEIASHPDRNKLLRVIGEKWNEPKFELSKETRAKKGDAFLLCSDGVWELVASNTISELLNRSRTAEEWLDGIIYEIEHKAKNKDMDNITAITVKV